MQIDRKALKRAAKQRLSGVKPNPMLVTLVFLLLTTGVSLAVQLISNNYVRLAQTVVTALEAGYAPADILTAITGAQQQIRGGIASFLGVLIYLYSGVVSLGYVLYSLKRTRGEQTGYGDLISPFGMAGRVIMLNLMLLGFTIVWSFAAAVPFSIAITLTAAMSIELFDLLLLPFFLGILVFMLFVMARYALAQYILIDRPDLGPLDAIRESRRAMRGRAGEYVKLIFSFAGWFLLILVIAVAALFGASMLMGLVMVGMGLGDTGTMVAAIFGVYGVVLLAVLPTSLWLTSYYHGVLAEYYCAILGSQPAAPAPGQPPQMWNGGAEADDTEHRGPDLF